MSYIVYLSHKSTTSKQRSSKPPDTEIKYVTKNNRYPFSFLLFFVQQPNTLSHHTKKQTQCMYFLSRLEYSKLSSSRVPPLILSQQFCVVQLSDSIIHSLISKIYPFEQCFHASHTFTDDTQHTYTHTKH